jgi:hypothetical protein
MIFNPFGDLVLDSQADSELIVVHHTGLGDQSVCIRPQRFFIKSSRAFNLFVTHSR